MEGFTWKAIHKEASQKLLEFRDRQPELLKILSDMKDAGLKAPSAWDKDENGAVIPLEELDGFSFLATFNRGLKAENRKALWRFLKERWDLQAPIPEDFVGIPTITPQAAWFIAYKPSRKPTDVPNLWQLFELILDGGPESFDAALFDRCLEINKVGIAKLTMGMFWANPDVWIAADGKNKELGESKGLRKPSNGQEYIAWAGKMRTALGDDIAAFSHQAHLLVTEKAGTYGTSLGDPFHHFFERVEDSHIVLDRFRESVLLAQDGETEKLPVLSTSCRKTRGLRWLRFNFYMWAVCYYSEEGDFEVLLPADFIKASYPEKRDAKFTWQAEGQSYGFWPVESNWLDLPHVVEAHNQAMVACGNAFRNFKGCSHVRAHRPDLFEAIMHVDRRPEILARGLQPRAKNLPELERKVWLIAPGEQARLWDEFRDKGIVAIGWNDLGDLQKLGEKSEIAASVEASYPESGSKQVASMLYEFAERMKPGDLVVAKNGLYAVLGWGVVTSDYRHDNSGDCEYHNIRDVDWRHVQTLEMPQLPGKSLTGYSESDEVVERLDMGYGFLDESESAETAAYTRDMALDGLFIDPQRFDHIIELMRRKKNIVLQGAPGTGKTYIARRLAYTMMGIADERRAPMIQFHQSMSYEDFIQGFRPGEDGAFKLRDGIFMDFCQQAKASPQEEFVLIIDEINRGNLSKIFGELMLLIEPDKRKADYGIKLAYAPADAPLFYVPENVYLIGTMNTADRSLSLVDYALRRRFAFVELEPGFQSPSFEKTMRYFEASKGMVQRIRSVMGELNERIAKDRMQLGPGFRIGHSFFVPNRKLENEEAWYRAIVDYEILPLIEEYWMDDRKALNKARELLGLAEPDDTESKDQSKNKNKDSDEV